MNTLVQRLLPPGFIERADAPVPYPTACSPQAWATYAPVLFIRTLIGLDVRNGDLVVDPDIPPEIGRISLANAAAFGKPWNVDAIGTDGSVRPAPGILRPRRMRK